jgi:hypothetical protein
VTHGYATGRPLAASEFSGGNATVAAVLRRLGFTAHGSTSPPWTRDAVILACDLVAANEWHELRRGDPRVTELSELLQRLPLHPLIERPPNFRSPDSVSRKTTDLYTANPDYQGTPTRGGHIDRETPRLPDRGLLRLMPIRQVGEPTGEHREADGCGRDRDRADTGESAPHDESTAAAGYGNESVPTDASMWRQVLWRRALCGRVLGRCVA